MNLQFGDIVLDSPVGRGAMAVVWKGRGVQGEPVAVKILTRTESDVSVRRFRDEARAVVRLNHPGIVPVRDIGVVPDGVPESKELGLVPGNPFLAMEFVSGGTLKDFGRGLSWRAARGLLLQMLDALGHAHAHGVIHRDLKPANVLVSMGSDGTLTARIADFGIAHTLGEEKRSGELENKVAGTPRYMSPEQIEGRWRDHGPWTDLYSLGCIAHWMVCGRAPFNSPEMLEVMRAHLLDAVEPLEGTVAVPAGFDSWLGNLLRKDPEDRFRRAADAAFGLRRLPPSGSDEPLWTGNSSGDSIDELTEAVTPAEWAAIEGRRHKRPTLDIEPGAIERPAIPRTWRTGHESLDRHVGLSLFSLRTLPFVGRESERDVIWSALHSVNDEHRAAAILLTGSSGTGKTRLAEWLARRAHEVGAASVLQVNHSPIPTPWDGFGGALAREFECVGLDKEGVSQRLQAWWARRAAPDAEALWTCNTIGELLPLSGGIDEQPMRVTQAERVQSVLRVLGVMASERPLILIVDDLQWGSFSLRVLQTLMTSAESSPILALATVRDGDFVERPELAQALGSLRAHDRVRALDVQPMDADTERVMIKAMLPLADEAVDEVCRRTHGNPLFATQILGAWAEAGALFSTGGRLRVSEEHAAITPSDIRVVWEKRISGALERLPDVSTREDAWRSFEVAAAFGLDVDDAQWRHACNQAHVAVSDLALDALLDYRLAVRDGDRWAFAHQNIREIFVNRATAGGRWRSANLAAAETTRWFSRGLHNDLGQVESRFLVAAGDRRSALRPLLRAARHQYRLGFAEHAWEMLNEHRALTAELDLTAEEPEVVAEALLRAELLQGEQRFDDARSAVLEAETFARWTDDIDTVVSALLLRAEIEQNFSMDTAVEVCDEAISLTQTAPFSLRARALLAAASTRSMHATHGVALGFANAILAMSSNLEAETLVRAYLVKGNALRQRGEYAESRAALEKARRRATDAELLTDQARTALALIRLARLEKDPDKIREAVDAAARTLSGAGRRWRARLEIERGLALDSSGRKADAQRLLSAGVEDAGLPPADTQKGTAALLLATYCARRADATMFRRWLSMAAIPERVGKVDRELAHAFEETADAALRAGFSEEAEHLLSMARRQWERLGPRTAGVPRPE